MKSKKILAVLMAAGMTLSLAEVHPTLQIRAQTTDPIQERLIRSVSYSS